MTTDAPSFGDNIDAPYRRAFPRKPEGLPPNQIALCHLPSPSTPPCPTAPNPFVVAVTAAFQANDPLGTRNKS